MPSIAFAAIGLTYEERISHSSRSKRPFMGLSCKFGYFRSDSTCAWRNVERPILSNGLLSGDSRRAGCYCFCQSSASLDRTAAHGVKRPYWLSNSLASLPILLRRRHLTARWILQPEHGRSTTAWATRGLLVTRPLAQARVTTRLTATRDELRAQKTRNYPKRPVIYCSVRLLSGAVKIFSVAPYSTSSPRYMNAV